LSIANAQITETRGQEYTVGLGYTFDQIKIPFTLPSKQDKIKSDLRTRADFSIRNNYTILRKLDTDIRPNEPTGGQRIMSIKLTADYSLSKNLNIRLFFDRVVNTPVISLAYPTANTNAGLSIRFTITG
jgi:cell surface protein SprA